MKASKNKLDFKRELKPFTELLYLLSIETGEKTELIFLYNKDGIIEEDHKYYKQDLTHIEGDLYKSDDGKIFKKEIKYTYSTRTAESELDFNVIFDREFQKRVYKPQKKDETKLAEILLKELNEYKNIFNDQKEYFLLRKATDYFIEYLENKKNSLLSQQNKTSTIQPIENQKPELTENLLLEKIEQSFKFMQFYDDRKHKIILGETDYNNLMKWVLFYFENNFKLPEIKNPIKIINTTKGNVVYTFKLIFKELHPSKTKPNSLFELIKLCFYDYRDGNIENYKKQKEPQYYKDIISNH